MSENPSQGTVRLGMAATAGADAGRRPRARAASGTRQAAARRTAQTISYHPNDALALAIVRAWSDNAFKNRLLTFSPGTAAAQYNSTRDALREIGISIEPPLNPVVLTQQQYPSYAPLADQVVFVLPDPIGSIHSFHNAQLAMCITVLGM